MLKGKDLIADIKAYQPHDSEFAVWWIGQHGFIVKLRQTVIYIDPFLTDCPERQVPPLLLPEEVVNADLILGTHDHDDHIDRQAWPAISSSSPTAQFIVPELVRQTLLKDLGIPQERFIGLDDCRTAEIKRLRITGIAAAHEFPDQDKDTGHYPYLGYVIEGNGCTIYHSGDTCIYEGLQSKLRRWKFDLMLLPINGRDAVRLESGCIGNMTYQEAADLAGALQPGLTIPAHYDMFAINKEDPELFVNYMRIKYPRLGVQVSEHGIRIVVGANASRSGYNHKQQNQ